MNEPQNRQFEYEMKEALGAALGSCSDAAAQNAAAMAVLQNVGPESWTTVLEKKLTIQIATDDSGGANGPVKQFWNAKTINPFAITEPKPEVGIIDPGDNTFTPGGNLGAAMCVAGICFQLHGEQECMLVPGLSVTDDDLELGAGLSPDAFTHADLAAAASGGIGAHSIKAFIDYGTPSWKFCEDLIRSQNFVWRAGNMRRIIDMPAENMASCGPRSGPRGLGRNDVATANYVTRVNTLYRTLPGFTARTFVPQNAVRDGFDPVAPNISTYIPSTAGQTASIAFGEERLGSKLYTNDCDRWFRDPLLLREGLPIQMFLEKNNGSEYLDRALQDLGSTYNGEMVAADGGTTFAFPGVGSNLAYNEWNSRAAVPAKVAQGVGSNVQVFKYGFVDLIIGLKGMLLVDAALAQMVGRLLTSPMAQGASDWSGFHGGQHLGGVMDLGIGRPLAHEKSV